MSRKEAGYYTTHDLIQLNKGDETRLKFPNNRNWKYQLALDITYKNKRSGKTLRWGVGMGSRAGQTPVCVSYRDPKFNYKAMMDDAKITGFNYCAGDQYDNIGTNEYSKDQWASWKISKVNAVYLIIWRKFKEDTGLKVPRAVNSPPKLRDKTPAKKPSRKELVEKYPTPKKYLNAQRSLKRKIKSQKGRALKRHKSK